MTSPGNYETDFTDMFAVHQALLTALDAAATYIGRAGEDPDRAAAVSSFYENVIEMLHVHHTGEDELLYPLLELRCVESRAALERIDAQHQLLPAPMAAAQSAIAAWRKDFSVARGRAVIDALSSISAALRPHLAEEEATVVPLAVRWISPEEMGRLAGYGMQAFRCDKPWLMLGLMREQLDPIHRDRMLVHMPAPMRTKWIEQMEPAFNGFVRSVRG
jgi:hemerythrin-like domain-containing protein